MGTKREAGHDEREASERFRLKPNAEALAIAELLARQIRGEHEKRTRPGSTH